jgi:hypothetical protein
VALAAPAVAARIFSTIPTLAETRTHHQYSLRLARPEKIVYFFQKRVHRKGAKPENGCSMDKFFVKYRRRRWPAD